MMEVDEGKIRRRLDEIQRLDIRLGGWQDALQWVLEGAPLGSTEVAVSTAAAKIHPQRIVLEIFRDAVEPLNIKMVIEIALERGADLKMKTVQGIVRRALERKIIARVDKYRFIRAQFKEAALAAMMIEEPEDEE